MDQPNGDTDTVHSKDENGGQHGGRQDQNQNYHLYSLTERFRRCRELSHPPDYWKYLYRQLFEYDVPLFQFAPQIFKFVTPENHHTDNPWKDSFQQLQHGLHVRPGFPENVLAVHSIKNFETVQDALNYAKNSGISEVFGHDALIFVHAGTHKGEIVIDSNVALLGASAGVVNTSVILKGEKQSTMKLVSGAEMAYVGYLSLNLSENASQTTEIHKNACLEITSRTPTIQFSPIIHECIIESSSLDSVAVCVNGVGAKPVIKYCVITGSKHVGLSVEDFAQGSYQYNKIICIRRKLCKTGILVKTMASPDVRNNFVTGYVCGIKVSEKGSGVFEENNISRSRSVALKITTKANPLVVQNVFESENAACIFIRKRGLGVIVGNVVNAHRGVGIKCSGNSNPTIKRNIIRNSTVGVNIFGHGRGWFQDNDIYQSSSAGICIASSNPTIIENKIHHNRVGIRVIHQGRGHIALNEIYSNDFEGVRIETASSPLLHNNVICEGHIGVYLRENSCGELESNTIFDNEYNINVESGSNPVIRKNIIRGGKKGGVSVTNRGLGIFEENEIFQNCVAGVCINDLSDPTLKANTISDNKGCGVTILDNGKGKLEENKIIRNSQSGVLICSESNPTLRKNEISHGLGAGIDITCDATATLEYNIISRNKFSGVSLATGVQPVLKENIIEDNEELVGQAVADGKCLGTVSLNIELLHEIYVCATCVQIRVCVSCARLCHEGHGVSLVRRDMFRCECGRGTLSSPCRLKGWVSGRPAPRAS